MLTHMKLKIGVMGSAGGTLMEESLSLEAVEKLPVYQF